MGFVPAYKLRPLRAKLRIESRSYNVKRYVSSIKRYASSVKRYAVNVKRYAASVKRYAANVKLCAVSVKLSVVSGFARANNLPSGGICTRLPSADILRFKIVLLKGFFLMCFLASFHFCHYLRANFQSPHENSVYEKRSFHLVRYARCVGDTPCWL